MATFAPEFMTIAALGAEMRSGAASPVQVAEATLARIAALDKRLHAFIATTHERALAEARAADSPARSATTCGPLHGIPYAVKDLYDVAGQATTAGTRLLAGNVAAHDCAAVRRLAAAGMVLVGKTHTVQFAFGGVGINHDHGTPHNPWHATPTRPADRAAGRAWPWARAWCRWRSAATPAARCASPPRSAGRWG